MEEAGMGWLKQWLARHPELLVYLAGAGAGVERSPVVITVNQAIVPPPDELLKYEGAYPGAIQRILDAADQQRRHWHGIESKLVAGSERRRDRGQLMSAGLTFLGLVAAAVLGVIGDPWIAGLIAVVYVVGPLAAQQWATMMVRRTEATCWLPQQQ